MQWSLIMLRLSDGLGFWILMALDNCIMRTLLSAVPLGFEIASWLPLSTFSTLVFRNNWISLISTCTRTLGSSRRCLLARNHGSASDQLTPFLQPAFCAIIIWALIGWCHLSGAGALSEVLVQYNRADYAPVVCGAVMCSCPLHHPLEGISIQHHICNHV